MVRSNQLDHSSFSSLGALKHPISFIIMSLSRTSPDTVYLSQVIIEVGSFILLLRFELSKGQLQLMDLSVSSICLALKIHLQCTIGHLETSVLFLKNQKQKSIFNCLPGPLCEKICLRGFRQCEFQISLLSYRDQLENLNFTIIMSTYIFQKANNKGPDQTARTVFSRRGPPYRDTI